MSEVSGLDRLDRPVDEGGDHVLRHCPLQARRQAAAPASGRDFANKLQHVA